MVPGAYSVGYITVSRGIGLAPPPKKFGPPPITSRLSKNWAWAWLVTANSSTATNPQITRITGFLS
jgi:hypothetical protein